MVLRNGESCKKPALNDSLMVIVQPLFVIFGIYLHKMLAFGRNI